jgi:hypothetical protein
MVLVLVKASQRSSSAHLPAYYAPEARGDVRFPPSPEIIRRDSPRGCQKLEKKLFVLGNPGLRDGTRGFVKSRDGWRFLVQGSGIVGPALTGGRSVGGWAFGRALHGLQARESGSRNRVDESPGRAEASLRGDSGQGIVGNHPGRQGAGCVEKIYITGGIVVKMIDPLLDELTLGG